MGTPNTFYGYSNVEQFNGNVEQLVRDRATNYTLPVSEQQICHTIKQIGKILQYVDGLVIPSNPDTMLFDFAGTYRGHNVCFTAGFSKLGISIERNRATITELKAL